MKFELNTYLPQIRQLCEAHKVGRLYVFGSALTERFTDDSDVDMIVDFNKEAIADLFITYFDFKYSLEDLFNRKVDLLEEQPIRNPYLKKSIDNSKVLIYDAR